jgi:esterase
MGGLVAMGFALRHPELTGGVASIDIAPRAYRPGYERELRALRTDIGACRTREELDSLLAPLLPEARERQFILTNAVREGAGFRWRIDPDILSDSTVSQDFAGMEGRFNGEALLVACGRSPYVRPDDSQVMRRFFPGARLIALDRADHWPHVSEPEALAAALSDFLARCNKGPDRPSGEV